MAGCVSRIIGRPPIRGALGSAAKGLGASVSRALSSSGGPEFTSEPFFADPSGRVPLPAFRVLDERGALIEGASGYGLPRQLAVRMYETMVRLQTMDTLFYEAQRQGRFSFYMTCFGEEATVVGSAAALESVSESDGSATTLDHVFAQYREHGVLLWRGMTYGEFADQLYGNEADLGKGRQMPIHYGRSDLNFQTISSPLATQLPQAAGAAYANKLAGFAGATVAYFGEGAASEGDFHAAMNFAVTLKCPLIMFCRNNGWAISTPAHEQYGGDGIAGRGPAYGMPALRVDGGDLLATYHATRIAREHVLAHQSPFLIEAMSYRTGHHSTSDDSTRYRTVDEMTEWKARDPVARFQLWLEGEGWWTSEEEAKLRGEARREVMKVIDVAERKRKHGLRTLVTDVYDDVPEGLERQYAEVLRWAKGAGRREIASDIPIDMK